MDENAGMIAVYTTFPNEMDATKIGRELVEEKLAACVNIFPRMISIYRWQDGVETGSEAAMLIKTRKDKSEQIVAALTAKHPYTVPAIIVFEPQSVAAPFLEWLFAQTAGSQ